MPIEETPQGVRITVKDAARFEAGSFWIQYDGYAKRVKGRLKATGRQGVQSIVVPEARLISLHGKKVVVTRSRAVSEMLFLIRQRHKVKMRIRLIR